MLIGFNKNDAINEPSEDLGVGFFRSVNESASRHFRNMVATNNDDPTHFAPRERGPNGNFIGQINNPDSPRFYRLIVRSSNDNRHAVSFHIELER